MQPGEYKIGQYLISKIGNVKLIVIEMYQKTLKYSHYKEIVAINYQTGEKVQFNENSGYSLNCEIDVIKMRKEKLLKIFENNI